MLKTSPILTTTSANASPTSYRYVPPSPQHSSKSASAIRRRHSSRSVSDSHRLKYVAIDAASQTSPMDDPPKDSARTHHDQPQQLPTPAPPPPAHPPQSPCPQPMKASPAASSAETLAQQLNSTPQNAVSPTKRRGSPGGAVAVNGQSAESGQPIAKTPKRPKPDAKPPKVLPIRYEFCPVEDMVELISHMLAELIATNDAIRISNGGLTRFHSRYFASALTHLPWIVLTCIAGRLLASLYGITYTAWRATLP